MYEDQLTVCNECLDIYDNLGYVIVNQYREKLRCGHCHMVRSDMADIISKKQWNENMKQQRKEDKKQGKQGHYPKL